MKNNDNNLNIDSPNTRIHISNRKSAEEQGYLEDYLTSLYNKNYFIKHMGNFSLQMIKGVMENRKNGNNDKTWSIMFCDIDGLKLANDTLGHIEADHGIIHIAHIMKNCIRTNRDQNDSIIHSSTDDKDVRNIPIRFGGDEFVIILPNCTKEKALLIRDRIKQQICIDRDLTRNMSLSIGISDTNDAELPVNIDAANAAEVFLNQLISIAEKRMYDDKNKDIKYLTDEEKKHLVLKHLNRVGHQIGFDVEDPDQIDSIIKILTEIKEDNQQKRTR